MKTINNYSEFLKYLNEVKNNEHKPTLLLHSCCGPCSSHVMCLLDEYFDITIFYYNPNIFPHEEFIKRLNEQKKIIERMNLNIKVESIDDDYSVYLENVKGLENLGERSIRCYKCYEFRLKKTYEYAKEHNFDFFSTTLSISPYKNSDWINEIGVNNQDEKCQFLYSNFKKGEGYKHSIELSKKYDIYRQEYCGCEFSLNEKNAHDE